MNWASASVAITSRRTVVFTSSRTRSTSSLWSKRCTVARLGCPRHPAKDLAILVCVRSAAAVIATLTIALGETWRHRLWIALVLTGWFALLAALAAAGLFERYVPAGLAATIASILLLGGGALFSTGWCDVAMARSALVVASMVRRDATTRRTLVLLWNGVGLLELAAAFALGVASAPGPLQLLPVEPSTAMLRTLPWFLIPGCLLPLIAVAHLAIFWKLWR